MELCPERGLDALAGLVARPEAIAERLDDVIGGDADVGRAALEHLHHGAEHACYRAERGIAGLPRRMP